MCMLSYICTHKITYITEFVSNLVTGKGEHYASCSYISFCSCVMYIVSTAVRNVPICLFCCLYHCRDGSVCGWSVQSGQLQFHYPCSHKGDFIAVDMCGSVVVSGSHDETVKLWQVSEQGLVIPELSIDVGDRVWALSVQPQGNVCCVGTAGYHQVPPLHVFDMER